MRKTIFTFILSCLAYSLFCTVPSSEMLKLRELYYKASADKDESERFYTYLKTNPGINSNVFTAYAGMSYMIKAKYSWNPYNKLSFFNTGKDKLEEAIEKDSYNPELRFLRFCIQTNAPGFLAYSSKIKEDKAMLIVCYPLLKDDDLKARIKEYVADCKYFTQEEKKIFI